MKSFSMFSLPSDVVIFVLTEWLSLKSVVRLDSAVSNSVNRSVFLRILASEECVHSESQVEVLFELDNKCKWFAKRHLKVSSIVCYARHSLTNNAMLEFLKLSYKSIQTIKWNGSSQLAVLTLNEIATNCCALKSFQLCSWNSTFTNQLFLEKVTELRLMEITFSSNDLIVMGSCCVNVETIYMWICKCQIKQSFPKDGVYFQKLKNLEVREVGDGNGFPYDAFEFIISNATKLETLYSYLIITPLLAKYCYNLTDLSIMWWQGRDLYDEFGVFFEHSPQLKILTLKQYEISDNSLEMIGLKCPNIEQLYLSYQDNQRESFVKTVKQMKKLKRIEFSGRKVLEALLSNCPPLEYMDFVVNLSCDASSYNENEPNDDQLVNRIPSAFTTLQNFQMNYGCGTNELLYELGRHCPHLEYISLSKANAEENAYIALVKGCRKLKWLDLNGANNITDKVVEAISQYSNKLTRLSLNGELLTADAYLSFYNGCHQLFTIEFTSETMLEYDESIQLALAKLSEKCKLAFENGYDNVQPNIW